MKSFQLKNIKSFEDTGEIELKPITVFVGPNSSGKSSLLRFPVVISQTYLEETISPIIFHGKYVDYGNFEDVVRGHAGDRLNFGLKFNLGDIRRSARYTGRYLGINYPTYARKIYQKYHELKLNVTIRKTTNKIIVHSYQISVDGKTIFSLQRENAKYKATLYHYFAEEELVQLDPPISFFIPRPVFEKFLLVNLINNEELIKIFRNIAERDFNYHSPELSRIVETLRQTLRHKIPRSRNDAPKIEFSSEDEELY